MKECNCKDYTENIDKLHAGFMLLSARNPLYTGYEGKIMEYCPWCGKKLIEKGTDYVESYNDID